MSAPTERDWAFLRTLWRYHEEAIAAGHVSRERLTDFSLALDPVMAYWEALLGVEVIRPKEPLPIRRRVLVCQGPEWRSIMFSHGSAAPELHFIGEWVKRLAGQTAQAFQKQLGFSHQEPGLIVFAGDPIYLLRFATYMIEAETSPLVRLAMGA